MLLPIHSRLVSFHLLFPAVAVKTFRIPGLSSTAWNGFQKNTAFLRTAESYGAFSWPGKQNCIYLIEKPLLVISNLPVCQISSLKLLKRHLQQQHRRTYKFPIFLRISSISTFLFSLPVGVNGRLSMNSMRSGSCSTEALLCFKKAMTASKSKSTPGWG